MGVRRREFEGITQLSRAFGRAPPELGLVHKALLQIVGRRRSCIHAEQFIEESYLIGDTGS